MRESEGGGGGSAIKGERVRTHTGSPSALRTKTWTTGAGTMGSCSSGLRSARSAQREQERGRETDPTERDFVHACFRPDLGLLHDDKLKVGTCESRGPSQLPGRFCSEQRAHSSFGGCSASSSSSCRATSSCAGSSATSSAGSSGTGSGAGRSSCSLSSSGSWAGAGGRA